MPTYEIVYKEDSVSLIDQVTATDIVTVYKTAKKIASDNNWKVMAIRYLSK